MAGRTKRGNGSIHFDAKSKCYIGRLNIVVNGRRVRPAVSGKTYTECSNALRRLQHKIASGEQLAKRDGESVSLYLATWLEMVSVEMTTLARYRSVLKKIEKQEWFVALKMHELTPILILKLYKDLSNESDSTRRKVHTLLHSAFEDARHLRRIALNPCDIPKKQKPKYSRPEVQPFTEAQEAAFITAIKGDYCEAMYLLAIDTGARQGELWALEWTDIDLDSSIVRINKSLKDDGTRQVIGLTKGKKERTIHISVTALLALRELRTREPNSRLMFHNADGGYHRRQNFNRRNWVRIMRKAGLEDCGFTFHDLRHSCATMLLRSGESIANVSRRLGHSKISTTLDYYAHALPEDDARAAIAFESRIKRYSK